MPFARYLIVTMQSLFYQFAEVLFPDAAFGAYPIFWKLLERGTCGNSVFWIPYGGVIDITADIAFVPFHRFSLSIGIEKVFEGFEIDLP